MADREELLRSIAALEAQRAVLGDGAVDTALSALRDKIDEMEDTGALEGERKLVTILFADLSGFSALAETMDAEAVRELMNFCFDRLAPVIDRYGGTVDKYIGDEVMVLFGAPAAQEDAPERALRAALGMLGALEDCASERGVDLGLHIGVNTGYVVAGGIGSEGRRQYSVMGSAVNLASELGDRAEDGQILVGPDTRRLAAGVFDFESLAPVKAKGREAPTPIYRLVGPKSGVVSSRGLPGIRAPLAGRREELARFESSLASLREGRGGVVSIVGEPGLGKSRLVAEAREANQEGLRWVEGRALSYTQGVSYALARDGISSLAGAELSSTPKDGASALRRGLEELAPDEADDLLPFLLRLLDLPMAEAASERLSGLTPQALRDRTAAAVSSYVLAHARARPTVFVWEDLHWADPSSLGLLERLLPLSVEAPLLFVLVFRPEGEEAWALHEELSQSRPESYESIELAPLGSDDCRTLTRDLLTAAILPDGAVETILEKAEGNPFFLEEVVRSLIDSGRVGSGAQSGAAADVEAIDVPDTLYAVIASRVDRLPEAEKNALQTASVLGRTFEGDALGRMLAGEMDGPLVEGALSRLAARELVRERDPAADRAPDNREFIFKHAVTQEVAYESMLAARRRQLHRRAGETLEALFGDRLEEMSARLAFHYERADAPVEALDYLTRAAARAAGAFANSEAIAFYRSALEQLGKAPVEEIGGESGRRGTAARLREGLGDLLELTGAHDEAKEAFEEALPNANEGDRLGKARVLRKIGKVLEVQQRFDEGIEVYDRADEALGPEPEGHDPEWWEEWEQAQVCRMYTYYWLGRADDIAGLAERAQSVAERYPVPVLRTKALMSLTLLALRRDRYVVSDEALENAREALEAARESGVQADIAEQDFGLGFCLLWRGDLEGAARNIGEALSIAEKTGNAVLRARSLNYLALTRRLQGDVDATRELGRQARAAAGEAGMPGYEGQARAIQSWVAWREGDVEAAGAEARAVWDQLIYLPGVNPFKWIAAAPLVAVAIADGAAEEAIENARVILAPDQAALPEALTGPLERALAAWDGGDEESARKEMERFVEAARERNYL